MIVQTWECKEVDGNRWLLADFRVSCNSKIWYNLLGFSILFLLLNISTIIFLVIKIFTIVTTKDPTSSSYSILFQYFQKNYFWWSFYEVGRVILLTSIIPIGSTTIGLFIGTIISAFALTLNISKKPYQSFWHNHIQSVLLIFIFAFLLIGLFLSGEEEKFETFLYTIGILLVTLPWIVIAIIFFIRKEHIRIQFEEMNRKGFPEDITKEIAKSSKFFKEKSSYKEAIKEFKKYRKIQKLGGTHFVQIEFITSYILNKQKIWVFCYTPYCDLTFKTWLSNKIEDQIKTPLQEIIQILEKTNPNQTQNFEQRLSFEFNEVSNKRKEILQLIYDINHIEREIENKYGSRVVSFSIETDRYKKEKSKLEELNAILEEKKRLLVEAKQFLEINELNKDLPYLKWIDSYLLPKTLFNEILQQKKEEADVLRFIRQICEALNLLHSNDLLYGDLHNENILLKWNRVNFDIYLIDYETIRKTNQWNRGRETCIKITKESNVKSSEQEYDLYCLGILIYQMYQMLIDDPVNLKLGQPEFHKIKSLKCQKMDEDFYLILKKMLIEGCKMKDFMKFMNSSPKLIAQDCHPTQYIPFSFDDEKQDNLDVPLSFGGYTARDDSIKEDEIEMGNIQDRCDSNTNYGS